MAKKVAKVDPKTIAKADVMKIVKEAISATYEVVDGADYGMTKGTIVVKTPTCDVQIKPITPKTGIARYETGDAE